MAQNWNFDPIKKDYVMVDGKPEETDSLKVPSYLRLKTQRGQWLYAPDKNYGSDLYMIKKLESSKGATLIENTAAKSQEPIVNDGRASEIDVKTVTLTRHGIGIQIKITDKRGQVEKLAFVPIGA